MRRTRGAQTVNRVRPFPSGHAPNSSCQFFLRLIRQSFDWLREQREGMRTNPRREAHNPYPLSSTDMIFPRINHEVLREAYREAARFLYAQAGFNEVGMRRNYYPASSGREDAIIMAYSLN